MAVKMDAVSSPPPPPFFAWNDSGYRAELFDFERNFDQDDFLSWIVRNWTQSFWYSAVYVVVIFALRRYMSDRPRFELRGPLVVWSASLAVFSIVAALRTVPELVHVLRHHGVSASVCNLSYYYGPTAFWCCAFSLSKVYELGDTVFIVLRKQPLIFLHWYHHVTVMIYVWYSYVDYTGTGRWFMSMNFVVHAFMYSYYAARAARFFRIPRAVSVAVTCLQITQMVVGMGIIAYTFWIKASGVTACAAPQSYVNIVACSAMYASYFVLFAQYFYDTYIADRSSKQQQQQKQQQHSVNSNGAKTTNNNDDYVNGYLTAEKKVV